MISEICNSSCFEKRVSQQLFRIQVTKNIRIYRCKPRTSPELVFNSRLFNERHSQQTGPCIARQVRLRDKMNQYYPMLITTFKSRREEWGFFRSIETMRITKGGSRPSRNHCKRTVRRLRCTSPVTRRQIESTIVKFILAVNINYAFLLRRA